MSKDKPMETSPNAADRLYSAFEEASTENLETLRSALRLEGIDLQKLIPRTRDLIDRLSRQRELPEARARLEAVWRALRRIGLEPGEVVGDLRERLAGTPESSHLVHLSLARYSKLESMTAEDLDSLKDDRCLLAFLVETENGEDQEDT